MRPEKLYLTDMVDAADAIARFLDGISREDFMNDELRQSAVLQKLIVIGEAAARLPADFKTRHSEADWQDIVAFRNIAVHAYFAVDWSIVWTTATEDVPVLRQQVERILQGGGA
ncbi:hypothetical protein HRbin16_01742 [bacterium HR16]|nr:hypothetical protein HRbin16_01742 [bacterium HR16]